jgi:cytochrome c biogenesis protein CcmG, thiol:disulfide interchange protein DsbE
MKSRPSAFAIAALVCVTCLIVLLAYGVKSNEPDRAIDDALARGERVMAPVLRYDRLSGAGEESLADHRGKIVVLNIWTSWCEPCKEESPMLERWHKRLSKDGRATVLGIDVFDAERDGRAFVREYDLTYPMLRDREGSSLEALGAIGYPETFVIDRRGRIAAAQRGVVTESFMRERVAPLVEGS